MMIDAPLEKSQVKVEELLKAVPVVEIINLFFNQAFKVLSPLPVASEDPGPVNEPPDEGGGEEHQADGHYPLDPQHNQSGLQNLLILTVHRVVANKYVRTFGWTLRGRGKRRQLESRRQC